MGLQSDNYYCINVVMKTKKFKLTTHSLSIGNLYCCKNNTWKEEEIIGSSHNTIHFCRIGNRFVLQYELHKMCLLCSTRPNIPWQLATYKLSIYLPRGTQNITKESFSSVTFHEWKNIMVISHVIKPCHMHWFQVHESKLKYQVILVFISIHLKYCYVTLYRKYTLHLMME